jgi:hypothetical protein
MKFVNNVIFFEKLNQYSRQMLSAVGFNHLIEIQERFDEVKISVNVMTGDRFTKLVI